MFPCVSKMIKDDQSNMSMHLSNRYARTRIKSNQNPNPASKLKREITKLQIVQIQVPVLII